MLHTCITSNHQCFTFRHRKKTNNNLCIFSETAENKAVAMGIDKDNQALLLQVFDDEYSHMTALTDTLMDEAAQLEGKLEELQLSESGDTKM